MKQLLLKGEKKLLLRASANANAHCLGRDSERRALFLATVF
jgi:hypothetical protein